MNNYDLLILSPDEFERLVRDLIQKELNLNFESFTSGKDNGIDLRYSRNKENDIIVQCKRYTNFKDLLSCLKNEVAKVKTLSPKRYIIATSVGLTPSNKNTISDLFFPYIHNFDDIIGKDDMNNYLEKHTDIEKNYYKLWLSSVNILEQILKSKTVNQSEFEKSLIIRNIELFVQNDSFNDAIEILNKNRFVLISGIPGIGKTTLARILVYYLLGNGMDEFIFVSDTINEAFSFYNALKKQIFFFDDFLGKRNFSKSNLLTNEDRRIIDFIKMINNSKNKYFIFTTREYVLKQAQKELESLNELDNDIKCIIDLQKYNKISRGRILYNHLFFYDVPRQYILSLIKDDLYIKLIDHPNYSPRLIEFATQKKTLIKIGHHDYGKTFISYFDNPEELWRHAYENQISELSKCLLAILATTGTPITYSDLELVIQYFSKYTGEKYQSYSHFTFDNSLHELEDTFIKTTKDSQSKIIIDFHNPSVHDFLCNYFSRNNHVLLDIINSAIFFDQIVQPFTSDENDHTRIYLSTEMELAIVNKILSEYDYLSSSRLYKTQSPDKKNINYIKINIANSDLAKISHITTHLSNLEYENLKSFLIIKLKMINISKLEDDDINTYINILNSLQSEFIDKEILHDLLKNLFDTVNTSSELEYYLSAKDITPKYFDEFISNDIVRKKITDICNKDYYEYNSDYYESYREVVDNISAGYLVNLDDLLNRLDEKIEETKNKTEEWKPDNISPDRQKPENDENNSLKDMFESLLQSNKYYEDLL